MRTSSSSSAGDNTRRGGRTAPRRHVNPADKNVAARYDSSDFPVLLRMPDILAEGQVSPVTEAPERAAPVEQSHQREETPSENRQRRYRRPPMSSRATAEDRQTGDGANRFWATLAPKFAIGGMLLAVTALCVVVLQGPSQSDTAPPDAQDWVNTSKQPADKTDDVDPPGPSDFAPIANVPNPTNVTSVASKPEPPRPTTSDWTKQAEAASTTSVPQQRTAAASDWQVKPKPAQRLQSEVPVIETESFKAQGWPDDLEMGATSGSDDELEFNAAARSAQRLQMQMRNGFDPGVRSEGADGARFKGTVEVPTPQYPQADYLR